ncbi:MAG: carboxymuconolactone decarboxylase family protein [Gemmatimonadota bacterium]|nr:MAG: carboxymuconolactone decarboxylase family protein [Gemmatimonadota bacterium]
MSLTTKEKELVSVGASLAAGCKPCTNYHLRAVRKAEASDEEIERAMSHAIAVRDNARKIMERHGLKLLGRKFRRPVEEDAATAGSTEGTTRIRELVCVAAAFAVNCTSSAEKHIEAARGVGVTDDEIQAVVDIARFIRGKADSLCCKLI